MESLPSRSACLIGAEGRCAVGLSAASVAAAIRAGVSNVAEHAFLQDVNREPVFCGTEPSLDPALPVTDRIARMAAECLTDLATSGASRGEWRADARILVALPECRPGFDETDAAAVIDALGRSRLPQTRSVLVRRGGEGHAGAVAAIRSAVALIETGREDVVVAGGVDSYLDSRTLAWLDSRRLLSRPDIRSGLIPGEGAAFVTLASQAVCDRLGCEPLARVRGIACTQESREANSYTGLLGEALGDAIAQAASGLRLPGELIADTYGDINGELARSHDWGLAVLRAPTYFADATSYVTTTGQCGDVGAATGALGCVLATEAWRFERATGPLAMVWAGSWGGLRGAMVLESGRA
jgi:3-oxoacyl-[acyl-carrier-protein] synthase-1